MVIRLLTGSDKVNRLESTFHNCHYRPSLRGDPRNVWMPEWILCFQTIDGKALLQLHRQYVIAPYGNGISPNAWKDA
jgi:hypothetical protein